MTVRFRNVDASPTDDVTTWPHEALVAASGLTALGGLTLCGGHPPCSPGSSGSPAALFLWQLRLAQFSP